MGAWGHKESGTTEWLSTAQWATMENWFSSFIMAKIQNINAFPQGTGLGDVCTIRCFGGFPGGSVGKTPPANARGVASWLRSLLREDPTCLGSTSRLPQLLSRCSRTQVLKPPRPRAHALQPKEPLQWEGHTLKLESSPYLLQLYKNPHSNENPAQPKINKENNFLKVWSIEDVSTTVMHLPILY